MSYDLLSKIQRKARKNHRCIWCGQAILVGENYSHETSVYDGYMQDHKFHLECRNDADEYFYSTREEDFDAYENKRPEVRLGFDKKEIV